MSLVAICPRNKVGKHCNIRARVCVCHGGLSDTSALEIYEVEAAPD